MRVQDVLKRKGHDVVTISPAASVGDLLKLLNEHRIGSVVVMDGDRMVGIVSERDILSRLAASDDDDIRTVPVHEVMSQTRVCSLDDDTAELAEVLRIAVPEFTPMSNEQNEASANIVVFPGRDARRTR